MAKLTPFPDAQVLDDNGDPLAGGKVYTYEAGDVNTTKETYTDKDEGTPLPNPIILGDDGRAEVSGNPVSIWLGDGSYYIRVFDADDNLIDERDDVTGSEAQGQSFDISTNTLITSIYANGRIFATSSPTLTLLTVADAGDGFGFWVYNNGSGTVTIDPDGSETINGSATLDIGAGEWAFIVCDGDEWYAYAKEVPRGDFEVLATASASASISLYEDTDNGSNAIKLQAPDSIASNFTLKLPSADGTNGQALTTDGSGNTLFTTIQQTVVQGAINGLTLSNDTDADHDINITAGQATDSANASYLTLASEITKQIDATWAAGDDAGGLFSGTVANDTTYHVFLIEKDSDGSIDAGFDTSITAANIPSGYTKYRRIGSIMTDGSANIQPFKHKGDFFELTSPTLDINDGTTGTTAKTAAINVPTGIEVKARCAGALASNGVFVYVSSPDATDTAPSATATPLSTMGNSSSSNLVTQFDVETNTSAQIRYRTNTSDTFRLVTLGWYDPR